MFSQNTAWSINYHQFDELLSLSRPLQCDFSFEIFFSFSFSFSFCFILSLAAYNQSVQKLQVSLQKNSTLRRFLFPAVRSPHTLKMRSVFAWEAKCNHFGCMHYVYYISVEIKPNKISYNLLFCSVVYIIIISVALYTTLYIISGHVNV